VYVGRGISQGRVGVTEREVVNAIATQHDSTVNVDEGRPNTLSMFTPTQVQRL